MEREKPSREVTVSERNPLGDKVERISPKTETGRKTSPNRSKKGFLLLVRIKSDFGVKYFDKVIR